MIINIILIIMTIIIIIIIIILGRSYDFSGATYMSSLTLEGQYTSFIDPRSWEN